MKKRIIITAIICFIVVSVTITLTLVSCKHSPKKETRTFGVWCWDSSLDLKQLEFAHNNGVNEIYYCTDTFEDETLLFIEAAKSYNMNVYLLCGSKDWINDWSELTSLIDKYNNYNSAHTEFRFSGIHLDVEPHQFEDFDTNEELYLEKFIKFADDITTAYPNIHFDFDIPAWFSTNITYNQKTQAAFKFIFDYADRVFLMSYRDTAETIYSFAKEEIDYAIVTGKTLILGVETQNLGEDSDDVTFYEEGSDAMILQLKQLCKNLPTSTGISIHYLKSWYNLKS